MASPYDHKHRATRDKLGPVVDSGQAWCTEPICLERSRWIQPGAQWDLSHDRVNGGYLGPSHFRCNRAEGGREKHKRRKRRWVL